MEKLFKNTTQKMFKILTIIFCFLGDFSILLYIYKKFNNLDFFKRLMSFHPTLNPNNLGDEMIPPLFSMFVQSLVLLLFLAIIIHSLVYILFWYEKKSAFNYIKLLSFLGAPTTLFFIVDGIAIHPAFAWFIIQIFLYAYIFFGLYYFKKLAK